MELELHKIITSDGLEYDLNLFDSKFVVSPVAINSGLPDINWETKKGYRQDGESEIDYTLDSRTLTIEHQVNACDREDYFNERLNLLNIVRPNRGGQLTYIFSHDDKSYAIKGRANTPTFSRSDFDSWDEEAFENALVITCFDPIWFNPDNTTPILSNAESDQLVFDITFDGISNIQFGTSGLYQSVTINNVGTWYSYPIITITGEMSNGFRIDHIEKGVFIRYENPIADGEQLVLDLVERTLTDSSGNNLWHRLDILSNIIDFRIEPDENTLNFYAFGTQTGNTNFSLSYSERFIGI